MASPNRRPIRNSGEAFSREALISFNELERGVILSQGANSDKYGTFSFSDCVAMSCVSVSSTNVMTLRFLITWLQVMILMLLIMWLQIMPHTVVTSYVFYFCDNAVTDYDFVGSVIMITSSLIHICCLESLSTILR